MESSRQELIFTQLQVFKDSVLPCLLTTVNGCQTMKVIHPSLVFVFELFKLVNSLVTGDGRLFPDEEDLGEPIIKMLRNEIDPSKPTECLFHPKLSMPATSLLYRIICGRQSSCLRWSRRIRILELPHDHGTTLVEMIKLPLSLNPNSF
jgi:hypothetical protein